MNGVSSSYLNFFLLSLFSSIIRYNHKLKFRKVYLLKIAIIKNFPQRNQLRKFCHRKEKACKRSHIPED